MATVNISPENFATLQRVAQQSQISIDELVNKLISSTIGKVIPTTEEIEAEEMVAVVKAFQEADAQLAAGTLNSEADLDDAIKDFLAQRLKEKGEEIS